VNSAREQWLHNDDNAIATAMPADRATRKAFQIGRAQAREVLKFRARALRKGAAALKAKPKGLQSQRTVEVDKALLRESAKLRPPAYWSPKVTPGLIIL
jgi:hypothetical protein